MTPMAGEIIHHPRRRMRRRKVTGSRGGQEDGVKSQPTTCSLLSLVEKQFMVTPRIFFMVTVNNSIQRQK
jgi:hypothetical protein